MLPIRLGGSLMKTTLNSKEYVTFARRFVKATVDQMDFEQLKSLVIDYIHEDLQKSYDDRGYYFKR